MVQTILYLAWSIVLHAYWCRYSWIVRHKKCQYDQQRCKVDMLPSPCVVDEKSCNVPKATGQHKERTPQWNVEFDQASVLWFVNPVDIGWQCSLRSRMPSKPKSLMRLENRSQLIKFTGWLGLHWLVNYTFSWTSLLQPLQRARRAAGMVVIPFSKLKSLEMVLLSSTMISPDEPASTIIIINHMVKHHESSSIVMLIIITKHHKTRNTTIIES